MINIDLLESLANDALKNHDLISWLKWNSAQIWNKIKLTRITQNLKLNETTLTQNLVFDCWQLAATRSLPIEIFESKKEKTNGNDLEIFVETNNGYLFFPCQAKIIKKNNHYTTIHHKSIYASQDQIDLLITYAESHKGVPIYLLYNYFEDFRLSNKIQKSTGFPLEYYGSSVVSAHYIKGVFCVKHSGKKRTIPSFTDLHPHVALPFHQFIADLLNTTFGKEIIEKFSLSNLNYFTRQEIVDNNEWNSLAPLPQIGFIIDDLKKTRNINPSLNLMMEFRPQFRIVLSLEMVRSMIFRLS